MFAVDHSGNLHNLDNLIDKCGDRGEFSPQFSNGQEALEYQQDPDAPKPIKNFCNFCMPGVSWESVIN